MAVFFPGLFILVARGAHTLTRLTGGALSVCVTVVFTGGRGSARTEDQVLPWLSQAMGPKALDSWISRSQQV